MTVRVPAIKVLLPKDTNALGTIFGGVILSMDGRPIPIVPAPAGETR